jgi:hypothetical protein
MESGSLSRSANPHQVAHLVCMVLSGGVSLHTTETSMVRLGAEGFAEEKPEKRQYSLIRH